MATLVEISSVTLPLWFLPQVNYDGEEERHRQRLLRATQWRAAPP